MMTTKIMADNPGQRQEQPASTALAARFVRRIASFRARLVLGVSSDGDLRRRALDDARACLARRAGAAVVRVDELDALSLVGSAAGGAGVDARVRAVAAEVLPEVRTILLVNGFEAIDLSGRSGAALAAAIERAGLTVAAVAAPDVAAGAAAHPLLGPLLSAVPLTDVPAGPDIAEPISRHHHVGIDASVVQTAVDLVARHLPDAPQHATAVDVLDDAAAAAAAAGATSLTPDDVHGVVAEQTGIPVARLLADELAHLRDLEARLRKRVIGQDAAVAAVAAAVRRRRTGVGDPDRPLGSFLFMGPTGVGKTELARALAATLFADDGALVRLDMGEYQEQQSVARLVGAPPGYVGYGRGGHLTEALRRNPSSVVLLDEIEKAHDDVFATLLAVLEDGRLTDGEGRTVDVRHAVVIMTSNLGTAASAELPATGAAQRMRAAVAERFAPEFRNRIDEVVVFDRLGPEQLREIVALQVRQLQVRLSVRSIDLHVTDAACEWLAERASDPTYGARPLRREVRIHLEDRIADEIVAGRLDDGGRVLVDHRDDHLFVDATG